MTAAPGVAARAAQATRNGQALAEALMTLTVQAMRVAPAAAGPGAFRASAPAEYGDPVRARVTSAQRPEGRDESTGGASRSVITTTLALPIHAFVTDAGLEIRPGWLFKVTDVGEADDPALLGVTYEVLEVQRKSHATARRLDVKEV